jgi:hypothetical protein
MPNSCFRQDILVTDHRGVQQAAKHPFDPACPALLVPSRRFAVPIVFQLRSAADLSPSFLSLTSLLQTSRPSTRRGPCVESRVPTVPRLPCSPSPRLLVQARNIKPDCCKGRSFTPIRSRTFFIGRVWSATSSPASRWRHRRFRNGCYQRQGKLGCALAA